MTLPPHLSVEMIAAISAVATTVGGVLLIKTYEGFIKVPIEEFWKERRSARALRARAGYEKYFTVREALEIDTLVYSLGLRPELPCIDVLYLEYARQLLTSNRARKLLLVFSRDLSASEQEQTAFDTLKSNVTKVFGALLNRVEIVNTDSLLPTYATTLFSPEFLRVLSFMESDAFLKIASDLTGTRIRSVLDFSRHHPLAKRGMSVYVHLMRSWLIRRLLEDRGDLSRPNSVVGFLIWETEVDKLGVLYQIASTGIKVLPLMGRSIYASRGKPVPVFVPGRSLNIFSERRDQIAVLEMASKRELLAYADILRTIVMGRLPNNDCSRKAMQDAGRSSVAGGQLATSQRSLRRPVPEAFEVVGLLDLLGGQYV